MVFNF